ncbi:MAG TPA: NAD-dependent protein deacylase [Bacilli bacterium]|jgi:NAD-dependent deacetylase|nr:NAD-dependent protein deacylase [Bacilli bacterium]HOD60488.1 NAD-dependent protein deacylase [Bacilli bacterium]HOH62226.1 NAD-dependent protein deacylase [Bacilli bacterium]HPM14611.1 NAD-dependent protein deacylase [Bacilli bacterium]HPY54272.1 NAD-dependent protein deacylase [Bacilli bacterium]
MKNSIISLHEIVKNSNNIVFFGGAGVSTESNIPDFRSDKGLYASSYGNKKYSPEEIISHHFFFSNPDVFFAFYREKLLFPHAKPNPAHQVLSKWEAEGKLKAIITQNIDNLHQQAGSKEVLELHGSVFRNYCTKCGKFFTLDEILKQERIPVCDVCGQVIKPDVVLFEEGLNHEVLQKAVNYIMEAEVLIVGGTSLTVYPAAGLIKYFRGNKLVIINKDVTPYDRYADLVIHAPVGEVLSQVYALQQGD